MGFILTIDNTNLKKIILKIDSKSENIILEHDVIDKSSEELLPFIVDILKNPWPGRQGRHNLNLKNLKKIILVKPDAHGSLTGYRVSKAIAQTLTFFLRAKLEERS